MVARWKNRCICLEKLDKKLIWLAPHARRRVIIQGVLVVNLEPAYIGFSHNSDDQKRSSSAEYTWRDCSVEEIRELLIELGVIAPNQSWSPGECIMRLPMELSVATLKRLRIGVPL